MTNEYGNADGVTRAATEVIDGHEYAVLDVSSNTTFSAIRNFMEENYYSKFVLQGDWVYTGTDGEILWNTMSSMGKWVILDLNGYTISTQSGVQFGILGEHIEIRDSSPGGTGRIVPRLWLYNRTGGNMFVYFYGGTFNDVVISINPPVAMDQQLICEVSGGVIRGQIKSITGRCETAKLVVSGGYVGSVENLIPTIQMAPYIKVNANGSFQEYDAYAVSTTDLASGVYNYAYGLAWELRAVELSNLAIPDDRTYYLWGRNQDGWYEYLDLRYVDGEWGS